METLSSHFHSLTGAELWRCVPELMQVHAALASHMGWEDGDEKVGLFRVSQEFASG